MNIFDLPLPAPLPLSAPAPVQRKRKLKAIPKGPCGRCGEHRRGKNGACLPCAAKRSRAWKLVPGNREKVRNPKTPCVRCGKFERGKAGNCLPCSRERTRAWLEKPENKEKAKIYAARRYQENPEIKRRAIARASAWLKTERGRKWQQARARTPEARLAARRNYRGRVANPEYRERQRSYQKEYKSVPGRKERLSALYRARKYGISVEEQKTMLLRQGGLCATCPEVLKRGRDMHLDHDHKTEKVRGFLCRRCNQAIAFVRDNPVIAEKIAAYLRHHMVVST
jgi:hypothetical protein